MAHEKEALSAFTILVRLREMSGLACACVHVSNCFFFSPFFCSLERITLRHSAVKSSFWPSPNKLWRWSVLSDRQELTAQSRQWRYYRPNKCSILRPKKGKFVNLYSIFSVSLLQLTLWWSKWLSLQGSGNLEKGKHSLINMIKNVKSEHSDSFKIYSKVKYILKFSYPIRSHTLPSVVWINY